MYGRDPLRILQGIVTNDVAGAPPDRAVYAALLTPKGRMLTDMHILRDGAEFLLDVPAAAAPAVLENFRRTVPPLFARYEDVSVARVVTGVHGPRARATLHDVINGELPAADEHAVARVVLAGEPGIVVSTRYAGVEGYDVVSSPDAAAALRARLDGAGVPRMTLDTLDVLRVEAGVPRWGAELTESTIPLEAGLERAISTSKGCYTGQEVIIRILHRGHVNWLLRGVLLGDASAAPDTALVHPDSGKAVGRITSCVRSPRLGQRIALAYVRREVEPPAELRLSDGAGATATVVALPFHA
jgi:aminomethyltransferase